MGNDLSERYANESQEKTQGESGGFIKTTYSD